MTIELPVAQPWFEFTEVDPGVFKIVEPHCVRLLRANLYLIKGTERDVLIDTGMGVGSLRAEIAPFLDKPVVLFTTHSHIDHVAGHFEFTDLEILVHPAEADALAHPAPGKGLTYDRYNPEERAGLQSAGFDIQGSLVDAVPYDGYDLDSYECRGVAPTRLVEEGDLLDIGSRQFEILHLPGHSPGSIALWEAETGTLFSGDAIYDGIIVDNIVGCDIGVYLQTMRRLRDLPVRRVHGGHRLSFGRQRLTEIVDDYVASRAG